MENGFIEFLLDLWRYGMKGRAEVRRLRERNEALTEFLLKTSGSSNVNVTNNLVINQPRSDRVTGYDKKTGIMYFGTRHGDLAVRFDNAETVIEDIKVWLAEKKLQDVPSPQAIRTILDLN